MQYGVLEDLCFTWARLVADAQTADDLVDYPKYKRSQVVQALKRTDESLVRRSVPAEREEQLRKEFEDLRPRFKDRRNDG
jgi:hypothetical protein